MGKLHMKTLLLIIICVLLCVASAQALEFTYTPINVEGARDTYALGINNQGKIVGEYFDLVQNHGFLYENGSFTTFDPSGSTGTFPYGINSSDNTVNIVGHLTGGSSFLYDGTNYYSINHPDATGGTEAYDINDSNVIVGFYNSTAKSDWAFVYDSNGYHELDVPGAARCFAYGINNAGHIVGETFIDFGGTVGNRHGFMFDGENFTFVDFPGADITGLSGINNNDVMVGWYDKGGRRYGFIFDGVNYNTIDPPESLWTTVWDINDSNQVVGFYSVSGGYTRGFSANPVPLPSALLLFGSGLLRLAVYRRKWASKSNESD